MTKITHLLCSTLVLLFVSSIMAQAQDPVPLDASERAALEELYTATGGDKWTPSWNRWDLTKDPATWSGVKIREGHVVELNLNGRKMTGEIPKSISNLKKLEVLLLYYNRLTKLPVEVFQLKNLRTLNFYGNNFNDKKTLKADLPETLDLPELELFNGGANDIDGLLPSVLNLPKIKYFVLGENNLTGPIPDAYTSLSTLELLDLRSNKLEGKIPQDWSHASALHTVVLDDNSKLAGDFPSSLCQATQLKIFSIQRCGITGTLPANLGDLTHLTLLAVNDNPIGGVIPESIGRLSELSILAAGNSNIAGPLPSSMQQLKKLERLLLVNMPLGGTIPEWIGSLTSLRELRLAICQLTGTIPQSIFPAGEGEGATGLSKLELLDLTGNQLEGEISPKFGKLTKLSVLFLGQNNFSGNPCPIFYAGEEETSLKKLSILELHDNKFSGEVGRLFENPDRRRTRITLHNNNFEGPILTAKTDSEYGLLIGFVSITLYGNRFVFQDFERFTDKLQAGPSGVSSFVEYAPQQKFGAEQSLEVEKGSNVLLSAKLESPQNLTPDTRLDFANKYQWYFKGSAIPNATSETYEVVSVDDSKLGEYYCQVTNFIAPQLTLTSHTTTLVEKNSADIQQIAQSTNILTREGNCLRYIGATEMSLFDLSGTLVASSQGDEVSISQLSRGTYIVALVANGVKQYIKFTL